MKRRNFLACLAGIFAAPFVVKKAIAATPAIKPYTVAVDWARDSVEMCKRQGITDHHSTSIVRVSPDGKAKVIYRFDRQNEEIDRLHNLQVWRDRMQKFQLMGP